MARNLGIGAGVVALIAATSAESAFIVYSNQTFDDNGTGFGNVLNILSVHQPGEESGSVLRVAGADVLDGDATNQSQTLGVGDLTAAGITSDNFAIVLNLNEPGSSDEVTLQAFSAIFYDANDNVLFEAAFNQNLTLQGVDGGTGGAGHLFQVQLSPAERAAFFGNSENRLGMAVPDDSPILNSGGGPDNFYVVPAAGSVSLLSIAGIVALAARPRRKAA